MKNTVTAIAIASALFASSAFADKVGSFENGIQFDTTSHYLNQEIVQADAANLPSLPLDSAEYGINQ